jgi:ATP-dependent Lon protease
VNAIDDFFILGSQMKQRDTKPVRKTVSGLIKLMHPDGNFTKEDVRQYLEFAIEMRRRVKEQLKRIGGMEFWDTNFSYIDKETQEETFVTLPEERGSNLIEDVPLAPGTCYTATSDGDKVTLEKIEVVSIQGNGKLTISGNASTEVKEDVRNTYNYIRANEKTILSQQHSLNKLDVNIQITALLGSTVHKGIGGAVFTALVSSVFNRSLKPALAVLGNISIGGAIERALNFSDRVSLLSENGAKNVLVPMDNLQEMANLPAAILGKTDVPFYSSSQMLIQKIL